MRFCRSSAVCARNLFSFSVLIGAEPEFVIFRNEAFRYSLDLLDVRAGIATETDGTDSTGFDQSSPGFQSEKGEVIFQLSNVFE